jgi:probable rRNA maturation factor
MTIHFHQEGTDFQYNEKALRSWLRGCFKSLQLKDPDITYIFCSDEYLLNINRSALQHDYYTDIITFDNRLESQSGLFADLFISVEAVQNNSSKLNTPFTEELKRVMIHGVLHLCGYNDKTEKEQSEMRTKEDQLLGLI